MSMKWTKGGRSWSARYQTLMRPLFGAASTSQAIAPRNGGVTNEAVINARMSWRAGMSERATIQAIGAATRVDMQLTQVATVRLMRSGASSVGSVNSRSKLASDGASVLSVNADTASQNNGNPTSPRRISAHMAKTSLLGSKRPKNPARSELDTCLAAPDKPSALTCRNTSHNWP